MTTLRLSPACGRCSHRSHARRRGFALALTSLMMVFIVSLMGVALDAGVLFAIRGRLSQAVETAAFAAARDVRLGVDLDDAKAKATESALRSVRAGFPGNYLGVDPAHTKLSASFSPSMQAGRPSGQLLVSVRAEVAAPVYFMKLWGVTRVPVALEGKAVRKNLVLIIAVDKSAVASHDTGYCKSLWSAAGQLADSFSPFDSVGMVSFNSTALIEFPASSAFKGTGRNSLQSAISRIGCGKQSSGEFTTPLETAYREIQRVRQKLAANVVLLVAAGGRKLAENNFPDSDDPAVKQAKRMRDDPNYRIQIDAIDLSGDASPPDETNSLPVFSNTKWITRRPANAPVLSSTLANRLHDSSQQEGAYAHNAVLARLAVAFAAEASALARFSQ